MSVHRGPSTERVIRRIEAAWAQLGDSYRDLTEPQLTKPGVAGMWSVKDVLGHITTWEEEALTHLPTIMRGGRPPQYSRQGGIDAFNARMADQKRGLPLHAVLEQMDQTHGRLIAFLQNTSEVQIASRTRFLERLRLDTYGHYRIHSEAIRSWRTHNL